MTQVVLLHQSSFQALFYCDHCAICDFVCFVRLQASLGEGEAMSEVEARALADLGCSTSLSTLQLEGLVDGKFDPKITVSTLPLMPYLLNP